MSHVKELIKIIPIVFFTVSLTVGLAQAQVSNDMLRGFGALKGLMDKAQKDNQPNPPSNKASESSGTVATLAGNSSVPPAPSNAAEYCEAIKTSPLVKEYVVALAEVVEKNLASIDANVRHYANLRFDNEDGQLQKWVVSARTPTGEIRKASTTNFGQGVVSWASLCAAQNHDNNLFLFFIANLEDSENIKLQRARAHKAIISLDSGAQDAKLNFNLGYENRDFNVSSPSIWVTLAAFALPNGIATMESTSRGAASTLSGMIAPALAAYEKRAAPYAARQKEKDRIEAQRVAAENKAKAEAERSQNSPNGLLLQAYQAFQMVQACFDARRGYALVYVNDIELNTAKEKMRRIDATLKPKLSSVTTDQLWDKAATENGIRPNNVKTAGVQQGQMFCGLYKEDMNTIAEKVLGKEAPKKSF